MPKPSRKKQLKTLRIESRGARIRKILVPQEAKVESLVDLDTLPLQHRKGPTREQQQHNDILVVIHLKDTRYAIIVEDTGRPEPKDLKRLPEMERELRAQRLIPPDSIVVRVVHHTGIKKGKTLLKRMATSMKIELVECTKTLNTTTLKALKAYDP